MLSPARRWRNHEEGRRLAKLAALLQHPNDHGRIEPRKQAKAGICSREGERIRVQLCRFEGAQNSVNRHQKSLRGARAYDGRMALRLTRRGRVATGSVVVLLTVLFVVGLVWTAISRVGTADAPATQPSTSEATPAPEPPAAEQELSAGDRARAEAAELRASGADPNSCVIEYLASGAEPQYRLETAGTRFKQVPIAAQEGLAFAGWYSTAEAAAAFDHTLRVNGASLVDCPAGELALHGSFKDREAAIAEDVAVPILMYHQFTTNPHGEDNWLRANYAYIGDLDAHLAYIKEQGFYLPTWDELSAFIDGNLSLPARSVIVTDDDAHATWHELAIPVIDAHQVLTTSFVITSDRETHPSPSDWVLQRSHTHAMHYTADNQRGAVTYWDEATVVNDLLQSVALLGASEVMAYPFGHYSESAQAALAAAGFELARTTESGYVRVGAEKLALPTIRIDYGMGVDALANLIN